MLALAMLTLAVASGCGDRQPAPSGPQSAARTLPERPPAWVSDRHEVRVTALHRSPGRLELDLTHPSAEAIKQSAGEDGFNLCLPPGKQFKLTLTGYQVGAMVLLQASDLTGTATAQTKLATPPERMARLASKGVMRRWEIYRLSLPREFWTPALRTAEPAPKTVSATVRIEWEDAATSGGSPSQAEQVYSNLPPELYDGGPGMERLVRHLVVNPMDLDAWALAKPPLDPAIRAEPRSASLMAPGAKHWAKLEAEREGLVCLSRGALTGAGLTGQGGGLDQIGVFCEGTTVPLIRPAKAAEAIYFYAWPRQSQYGKKRVYWVADGVTGALPVLPSVDVNLTSGPAIPLTRVMGKTLVDRDNHLMAVKGDYNIIHSIDWVDARLTDGKPIALPATLPATAELTSGVTVKADLRFYVKGGGPAKGKSKNPWGDAKAALMYNQMVIGQVDLASLGPNGEASVELPAWLFEQKPTTLTLVVTQSSPATRRGESGDDGIWLDWIEFKYPAAVGLVDGRLTLDQDSVSTGGLYRLKAGALGKDVLGVAIDSSEREARLLDWADRPCPVGHGWRTEFYDLAQAPQPALTSQAWDDGALDIGDGADYLVIAYGPYMKLLGPLLDARRRDGLRVHAVDVQQLYDAFTDGMLSPDAIRDYLGYLMARWGERSPQYVLLVGDCSNDFMDRVHKGVTDQVPSYVEDLGGYTCASEIWYTRLCGKDFLPDLMLGRFSVLRRSRCKGGHRQGAPVRGRAALRSVAREDGLRGRQRREDRR